MTLLKVAHVPPKASRTKCISPAQDDHTRPSPHHSIFRLPTRSSMTSLNGELSVALKNHNFHFQGESLRSPRQLQASVILRHCDCIIPATRASELTLVEGQNPAKHRTSLPLPEAIPRTFALARHKPSTRMHKRPPNRSQPAGTTRSSHQLGPDSRKLHIAMFSHSASPSLPPIYPHTHRSHTIRVAQPRSEERRVGKECIR
jgi:hypothetical protein